MLLYFLGIGLMMIRGLFQVFHSDSSPYRHLTRTQKHTAVTVVKLDFFFVLARYRL